MTALVIGNRKTKEVEIIFGASQDPSRIPEKDSPVKLENFQGSEKLKNYIEQGKNGEYAINYLKSIGKTNVTKDRLLLPIPQTEMDSNNAMVQNPGY